MLDLSINQERNPSVIAAYCNSNGEVSELVSDLKVQAKFTDRQINIIHPNDTQMGRKLEPDGQGIKKTLWKSHLKFGLGGIFVGGIISCALILFGPTFMLQNAGYITLFIPVLTLFISLLVAGLFTLRPDHDPVINATRKAIEHGMWAVVVRTKSSAQTELAEKCMKARGDKTVQSL